MPTASVLVAGLHALAWHVIMKVRLTGWWGWARRQQQGLWHHVEDDNGGR